MAYFTGNTGTVTAPSLTVRAYHWDLSTNQRIFNTSTFANTTSDTFVGGPYTGSGTIIGRVENTVSPFQGSPAVLSQTPGSFQLGMDSGHYVSFSGLLGNVTLLSDRYNTENNTVSYAFITSGDITVSSWS